MLGLDFETSSNQEFNNPFGVSGCFGFVHNVEFLTNDWESLCGCLDSELTSIAVGAMTLRAKLFSF